jgi:ribosomal protein L21E
MEYEVF